MENVLESHTLTLFFKELREYPLLTRKEEVKLGERILLNKKDDKAINILVCHSIRFIYRIAKSYRYRNFDYEDLIQEGIIGLFDAAKRFDHTLGFRFKTYADWWIHQSISKALHDKGSLIRKTSVMHGQYKKIRKEIEAFKNKFNRQPSIDEIALRMNQSVKKIKRVMFGMEIRVRSFSHKVYGSDGETSEFGDLIKDQNTLDPVSFTIAQNELENEWESLKLLIYTISILKKFHSRNFKIFCLRFGLDRAFQKRTLKEVGIKFNITKERVRKIVDQLVWEKLCHKGIKMDKDKFLKKLKKIEELENLLGISAAGSVMELCEKRLIF